MGGNSAKIILPPFWKGVYSKRKEFAPKGSKFFPFRVDPFQKESDMQEQKEEVTIIVSLVENNGKSTRYIQSH